MSEVDRFHRALSAQLNRGHLPYRIWRRALREAQHRVTTGVLGATSPRAGHAAVVTLNADEENASAMVVQLGQDPDLSVIDLVSPEPALAHAAVIAAARRLELPAPSHVNYLPLSYGRLLSVYRRSGSTYSTHVLLPGVDRSGRRTHTHLTHGSGPKPDRTFRGPTTVLASITPEWVPQQLEEYGLPADTPVIDFMPRLEIMRRAVGDRTVKERLGIDPDRELIVWAPTYRAIRRGPEVRISGAPFGLDARRTRAAADPLVERATTRDAALVVKVHPHDAGAYEGLGAAVFTNERLRATGLTPYELFGAADLLVTDYSSVFTERRALGLPYELYRPDEDEFARSYRGLRR